MSPTMDVETVQSPDVSPIFVIRIAKRPMETAADMTSCPKFTEGWNQRRSRTSAGVSIASAAIVVVPSTADSGPNATAAVIITMIEGLANSLSLTSTAFHSKNTKAPAKTAHSQNGWGKSWTKKRTVSDRNTEHGEDDGDPLLRALLACQFVLEHGVPRSGNEGDGDPGSLSYPTRRCAAPASKAAASVPTVNASLIKVLFTRVSPVVSFLVTDIIRQIRDFHRFAGVVSFLSFPGCATTSIAQSTCRPGKSFMSYGSTNTPVPRGA